MADNVEASAPSGGLADADVRPAERDEEDVNPTHKLNAKIDLDRGDAGASANACAGAGDNSEVDGNETREQEEEEEEQEEEEEEEQSVAGAASTITNEDVITAYKKFKHYKQTVKYLLSLPSAPKPEDVVFASVSGSISRLRTRIQNIQKSGRPASRQLLDELLKEAYQFPMRDPLKSLKVHEARLTECSLDSEENLLMAHATVDGELAKWAAGVERGFQQRETEDVAESEAIEDRARKKRKELSEIKAEIVKKKKRYEQLVEEAERDEALGNEKAILCRERQENMKKDQERHKLVEETKEIMQEIAAVRDEKAAMHQKNDALERENQELRDSVSPLVDRRYECRINEQPGAPLKAETKKMVGELLRLGVPTEGVNVVVRRILEGLNDFNVEGWPTPEDIEKINNEDREETF